MRAFLPALLFFLFQGSLYTWAARLYQTPGWTASPLLLFGDRLIYALIMPALGALLYFRLTPYLLANFSVGSPRFTWFQNGSRRLLGILWGMATAAILFGLVYIVSELLAPGKTSGGLKEEILRTRRIILFLLTTGILTPILEELYYRGVLQEFLQRALTGDTGGLGKGRLVLAITAQAVCFGLVHARNGAAPTVMLFGAGLMFGILYWRYGLASSILAHSCYNLAILFYFQANAG